MKVAIISDLHCKHSSNEGSVKSTLLYSDDVDGSPLTNPIKALKNLLITEKIKCDIVVCPGDIADKADPQGLSTGWSYLESVQRATNAGLLVATVGNHDVNVKCADNEDPNKTLKNLDLNYPIPSSIGLTTQYWQDHFCLIQHERTLILLFNSCHSHRNSSSSRTARIDLEHLTKMENALKNINQEDFDYRIALCHHHPINHGNLSNPDSDLISNGDDFVKLMESFKFQIVIHGHKHEPKLSYKDSIPIFCSGSLSSTQNVYDLRIENTFHVLELSPGNPMGRIETWVLIPRKGWIKKPGTYFPCYTGFGFRSSIDDLASRCIQWMKDKGTELAKFDSLKSDIPELDYLTPNDQNLFNQAMEKSNAELTPSFPDPPVYIGLKILKDESA
jgi:predicted phosphodiesterase